MPISRDKFEYLTDNISLKIGNLGSRELKNPVKIFLALLKNDESLQTCAETKPIKFRIANVITDIWKPNPKRAKDIEQKKQVAKVFPRLIDLLYTQSHQETLNEYYPSKVSKQSIKEELSTILAELASTFQNAREKMRKKWEETANPFLTAFIDDSWSEGTTFQIGAKTASSVETSWGNWIERAIYAFNPNLFYIAAGGMDFVKGTTAYDVKAGPQVMNKDQVEEVKTKNRVIKEAFENTLIGEVIGVSDFKVAISYGRREIAWPFMAAVPDLIVYGPETWDILTGDEWNAFELYLSCIEYKVEKGASWTLEDLEKAVKSFVRSFYGDNPQKERHAFSHESYISLSKHKHFSKS